MQQKSDTTLSLDDSIQVLESKPSYPSISDQTLDCVDSNIPEFTPSNTSLADLGLEQSVSSALMAWGSSNDLNETADVFKSMLDQINGHLKKKHNLVGNPLRDERDLSTSMSFSMTSLNNQSPPPNMIELEVLGKGSFGCVCKLFDTINRRFYAEKYLNDVSDKAKFNILAKNELRALMEIVKIDNSNLLDVIYMSFKPNKSCCILMECGIGTLEDIFEFVQNEKITFENLIPSYTDQIKEQTKILANYLICHRDIKPGNIIITEDFRLKFADFGCAEKLEQEGPQKMKIKGTPNYMNPELLEYLNKGELTGIIDPFAADNYAADKTIEKMKDNLNIDCCKMIAEKEFNERFKAYQIIRIFEKADEDTKYNIAEKLVENFVVDEVKLRVESIISKLDDSDKDSQKRKYMYLLLLSRLKLKDLKFLDAIDAVNQALNILKKMGNEEFYTRAKCYRYLGLIYEHQNKFNEAYNNYEKSRVLLLKKYDENHVEMAPSYYHIGTVLKAQNKFEDALVNYEKALKILVKVEGDECSSTVAKIYNNIGITYKSLGKNQEAIECLNYALGIQRKIYYNNPNHGDLAPLYNNMGTVFDAMGNFKEALHFYKKGYDIRKRLFKSSHPDLAKSLNSIGMAHKGLGEYPKAIENLEKALEIAKATLKEDNSLFGVLYNNIGLVYKLNGKLDEAIVFYNLSLSIKLKTSKPNSPEVAKSYNNIGMVFQSKGDFLSAIEQFKKALEIYLIIYKEEHNEVARCYNNMGNAYNSLGCHEEARKYLEKSLIIRTIILPEDHIDIAANYTNLGNYFRGLEMFEEAREHYEKSLEIRIKHHTGPHIDLIVAYHNCGLAMEGKLEVIKAYEYFEKAYVMAKLLSKTQDYDLNESRSSLHRIIQTIAIVSQDNAAIQLLFIYIHQLVFEYDK